MQGGCICENAPNLRIDTSNIEIAALAAPRPLLLVSATDDFTREAPIFAYPAIREVYGLFGATEKVDSVHIAAGHNYNGESRAAVYAWFGRWLLGTDDTQSLREQPRRRTAGWTRDSLVFYGTERPERDMDDRGPARGPALGSSAGDRGPVPARCRRSQELLRCAGSAL